MLRKINKGVDKRQLLIVASLFMIVGIGFIGGKILLNKILDKKENQKISDYYEIQNEVMSISEDKNNEKSQKEEQNIDENYIAILKIPKINLTKGIYSKDSYMNNVNRSIQIIEKSDYPDVEGGNFILAAHSGTARISYFRNLSKLSVEDKVSIDYNGKTYNYKVANIYSVEKTGKVEIKRNNNKNALTLITCEDNTNKQIVVICQLTNKGEK